MKSAFASVALFVTGALAQFMINTPFPGREEPVSDSSHLSSSPMFICSSQRPTFCILPGATPNGIALESFPQTNSTSYTWLVNIASGTVLFLFVCQRHSSSFIASNSCLNSTSASPGPTASDSGSSTAAATVTGGSSTDTGTGAASGTSSSPTSTSTSTSGASANVAQFGAAGIIGVAVAALFL
ncbi:hypothetical protein JVT61DRAFT_6633 [Boletus reticuloceps]|uniref:GPI anchored protein n=1 Tax=Boletus reticuloceps TaxID=495285 RepID=A0A8I3A6G5_9AGAM|nr:hypothetical protein JVT61DRAFT_6633 [Boletus reticuloceps]